MSFTYFSKQVPEEKLSRLTQLGQSKGAITVWVKGDKTKHQLTVNEYDKDRTSLVLNSKDKIFPVGTSLLCSFELRGMNFFGQVTLNKSVLDYMILEFSGDLFKAEKRNSFRLLTFPIYEIYAEFNLDQVYEAGHVIDIKAKSSQTALFKNFLKLVDKKEDDDESKIMKHRLQDLSTSGMSLHIGELDAQYFIKDVSFKNVSLIFNDESIVVPEVKVVYIVDYVSSDRNLKKFKVGLNFTNLPTTLDEKIGKKINQLLRQIDSNKDFENFTK